MTPEQRQAARERAENATPGPWRGEKGYSGDHWLVVSCGESYEDGSYFVTTDHVHASEYSGDAATDADFIAHARTDLPAALDALDDAEFWQYSAALALQDLCAELEVKEQQLERLRGAGMLLYNYVEAERGSCDETDAWEAALAEGE